MTGEPAEEAERMAEKASQEAQVKCEHVIRRVEAGINDPENVVKAKNFIEGNP